MRSKIFAGVAVASLSVWLAGCNKQVVAAARPAPPPALAKASSPPAAPGAKPAETGKATLPRMPDTATRTRIQDLLNRIEDVYFDYDKHSLRPDAFAALQSDAKTLTAIIRQYPNFSLIVQGFCDERGSDEYNLALGDSRARKAKEYLTTLGLPANQLRTISYGKERPVCTDHNETCWQKNRRAHITQAS